MQISGTLSAIRTQPATADEVETFLVSLDRLAKFWRDGEISDEEFRFAKATLFGIDSAPEPVCWPAGAFVPLD